MSTVDERIARIRLSLIQLKQRLEEAGYEFQEPDAALPGPDDNVNAALARLDQEFGPIPLALRLFYQRIGSINFLGQHPDWEGWDDAYPDPLFVYPVNAGLQELDEFLSNRENYEEHFETFRLPIAPDDKHKADVSGGMWYNVALPNEREDPWLLDEWHETTFLNYLEIALRWGGFPGIERWNYQGHNWPLAELAKGFNFPS